MDRPERGKDDNVMRPKVHSFACWLETDVAPAHMDRFTPEVTSMIHGMVDRWRCCVDDNSENATLDRIG